MKDFSAYRIKREGALGENQGSIISVKSREDFEV